MVALVQSSLGVVSMLDIMDVERGTKVAGGRGYFLKGDGAMAMKHEGSREGMQLMVIKE